MRVALDTSATAFDPGGTARYIRALLANRERFPGVELVDVAMTTTWPWTARLPRAARILVHDLLWVPRGVAPAARRAGADLLHGPAFRVPSRAGIMTSVTIHDDTPWDDPPSASWWTRTSLQASVRRAAPTVGLALVSTESVAAALREAVPALEGRVRVTPLGIDHATFMPQPAAAARRRVEALGITGRYVLVVGPYGPRKNYPAMCAALDRAGAAGAGVALVVVGRAPAAQPHVDAPLHHLGRVSDADLAALYASADFLFFASLKEGFGFPLVEAMACGCPVLASRDTALEELAGDTALLVDPYEVDDMAAGARRLLEDATLRERLRREGPGRAAGFSWERTVTATAAAWHELSPG